VRILGGFSNESTMAEIQYKGLSQLRQLLFVLLNYFNEVKKNSVNIARVLILRLGLIFNPKITSVVQTYLVIRDRLTHEVAYSWFLVSL
jgi:hypothetical protein